MKETIYVLFGGVVFIFFCYFTIYSLIFEPFYLLFIGVGVLAAAMFISLSAMYQAKKPVDTGDDFDDKFI